MTGAGATGRARRATAFFIAFAAIAAIGSGVDMTAGATLAHAQTVAFVRYVAPVDGAVVDPFRPPGHIGASGNRGLEYGNQLWAPVSAAADGRVSFAGQVFGNGTVVIEHADGVRTTYTGMSELWVAGGQVVRQLDGIGMAGTNLHFGALRRNTYLDPQLLIDASNPSARVRLVPVDADP